MYVCFYSTWTIFLHGLTHKRELFCWIKKDSFAEMPFNRTNSDYLVIRKILYSQAWTLTLEYCKVLGIQIKPMSIVWDTLFLSLLFWREDYKSIFNVYSILFLLVFDLCLCVLLIYWFYPFNMNSLILTKFILFW